MSVPDNLFYVIPDTSWLLRAEAHETMIRRSIQKAQLLDWYLALVTLPLRVPFKILRHLLNLESPTEKISEIEIRPTFVLLSEVTNEVVGLHTGNRTASTGNAKDCIRRMKEWGQVKVMSAKDVDQVALEEGSLGIDSKVDHGIVSTAVALSAATNITRVVVLTHDSGIKLELSSQRRKHGFRVYGELRELCNDYHLCQDDKFDSDLAEYLMKNCNLGRII